MYRGRTVGVAVPAYNEEGYVGRVIDSLPAYVDRAYVVDDGSTDGTWDEIRRHAAARNRDHDGAFDRVVVPIQHPENRGVGGAIKTAYRRACEERIDVTTVLGGDDQMDVDVLTRFLDPIVDGEADYTKGNRIARPEERAAMPRFRLVGNLVLSGLTKVASGYWGSLDSQNGYTAISLNALERADVEGMYEYYGYCNDLLVRLNVAGLRVADVPQSSAFVYEGDWQSHIRLNEYVPKVSLLLLRSFGWRVWHKYLRRGRPLGLLYPLGPMAAGASLVGLLGSLRRDRDGTAGWLLGFVAGVLAFVAAATVDRAANRDLEAHVETWSRQPVLAKNGALETDVSEKNAEEPRVTTGANATDEAVTAADN